MTFQASRDLGLHVSSKLSGEWSAGNVTSLLSEPVLEHLLSRWESLDPLVRARLLLSPLFLRKKDLKDLQPELAQLAEAGCGDRDEWVRVLGRAVGPYDGRLHLDAVLKDSKLVGKTLNELRQLLDSADPTIFRPLEELYLNTEIQESLVGPAPNGAQHAHFRARQAREAPSARQPGASSAAAQRSGAGAAAAQMAGGSQWAPRTSRPQPATPQAGLFLPSKPVQRLHSGVGGSGALFVGSSGGGRGGGAGGAAAADGAKSRRPAMLDPVEVRRMNEAAQRERERLAAEAKAAKEAEARARAEQRAAEKAAERSAKGELKRKRSGAPGIAEQASSKTPRTTDSKEVPQQLDGGAEQGQQEQQQGQQEQQGGVADPGGRFTAPGEAGGEPQQPQHAGVVAEAAAQLPHNLQLPHDHHEQQAGDSVA